MRLKRFTPVQKVFHGLLMGAFLVQTFTGVARMYIETAWGKMLAQPFGGYDGCLEVHKIVGLFMLILFVCHLVYVIFVIFSLKVTGNDLLLPRSDDLKQMLAHLGWMFGGKAPRFERWGYWEKFDYWAVFWGMIVLGITGVMLYSPLDTTAYFKGWSLNVALWVHRIEACLAMLHVFIIHFAIAHLRRHNFPMDRAVFLGDTDLDSVTEEKPAWIARLRTSGQLEERTVGDVSVAKMAVSYMIGLGVVALGVYMVIGGLMNACFVSW